MIKTKKGFTLVEIVVVMAIIAVLATLVVGAITVARNVAKETTHRANAKTIQTALEAKYARDKRYNNVDGTVWYDLGNARNGFAGAHILFPEVIPLYNTPECNVGTHYHQHPGHPSDGQGLYMGGTLEVYEDRYTIYIADATCNDALTETLSSQ